ncbi:unnamed protein product, partial [Fusarium graminearum]
YNGEWVLSAVKVSIRRLVISEEVYVLTDHWMNSYGCYLRNARTSLIICCRRLLMRDGRHQLNILRKVLAVNSTATNCN